MTTKEIKDALTPDAIRGIFDDLLGPGKGTTRRCFNKEAHSHGDKTPALSFSPTHGGWKCHACGITGDIFSLIISVQKSDFPEAARWLRKRLGLKSQDKPRTMEPAKCLPHDNADLEQMNKTLADDIPLPIEVVKCLTVRYGISKVTAERFGIHWSSRRKRLCIPLYTASGKGVFNIKYHDIMRLHALWYNDSGKVVPRPTSDNVIMQNHKGLHPRWDTVGKSMSAKGFGGTHLYPLNAMPTKTDSWLYVLGGELKAVAAIQRGINAVSFTGGEGKVSHEFLPFFIGRKVRVILDPDQAGVKGADEVAKALTTYAKEVHVGLWRDTTTSVLPEKGDITDLFTSNEISCEQDIEELFDFKLVEYEPEKLEAPGFVAEYTDITYDQITDASSLGKSVKVKAILAGRGESPYALPCAFTASCEYGERVVTEKCKSCSLPSRNFKRTADLDENSMLMSIDKDATHRLRLGKQTLGIPNDCHHSRIVEHQRVVDMIMLGAPSDGDASHRNSPGYLITEEPITLTDNNEYAFTGKVASDPRTGKFSLIAKGAEKAVNAATSFTYDAKLDKQLESVMSQGDVRLRNVLYDIADHACRNYGGSLMLLSMLANTFSPFHFSLGRRENDRIDPVALIIGDSSTGKSASYRGIMRWYAAGRYYDISAQPTFAGLIGGLQTVGKNPIFSWGVLPSCNGSMAGLDEFNKMEQDDIGKLTNMISSGVAERVMVGGARRTSCKVRLCLLANVKHNTTMRSTRNTNITLALRDIFGTPQDIGRLDFVHVHYNRSGFDSFSGMADPVNPVPKYTQELARYHLSWAWNIKKFHIDHTTVVSYAKMLSKRHRLGKQKNGENPLLMTAMVPWKIARVACSIAALEYSTTVNVSECLVTNDHVLLAAKFLDLQARRTMNPKDWCSLGVLLEQGQYEETYSWNPGVADEHDTEEENEDE